MTPPIHRKFNLRAGRCTWEHVDVKSYKPDGNHFRDITRQVLFGEGLPAQLRYFEIEPGGYSSFERHRHVHAVMALYGCGRVLVGERVYEIEPFDLISVPPMEWHQFYAAADRPLGFLCLVDGRRDRPVRPSAEERAALRAHPVIADIARW